MQTDDLAALAFGQDIFDVVLNLFPAKEALKLGKESEELGRRSKARMEHFIKELDKMRNESNWLDKNYKQKPSIGGGGGSGGSGSGGRGHTTHHAAGASNPECRICKHLQANQPHDLGLS